MRLRRQTRRLFEEMYLSLSFFAFSNSFFSSLFFVFLFLSLFFCIWGSPPFCSPLQKEGPEKKAPPKKKVPVFFRHYRHARKRRRSMVRISVLNDTLKVRSRENRDATSVAWAFARAISERTLYSSPFFFLCVSSLLVASPFAVEQY